MVIQKLYCVKAARTEDLNYSHKNREGRQEEKRKDGKKNVKGEGKARGKKYKWQLSR